MVAQRQAAHVWLHLVLAAALGACAPEDSDEVGATDGAAQPGAGFDAGAITGGAAPGGGTTGGFPGGGTTGGGTTGGGTTGGGTTGGFFGGGIPGARPDAGRPDAGPTVDAGTPVVTGDAGPDQFAELRQICVDTINMYRATEGLAPVARANATQEACSDRGAQYDGERRQAHAAAAVQGLCGTTSLPGTQNTCPGWQVGPGTGNATLADALKRCLAQMWEENAPPVPVPQCKMDQSRRGCFVTHGHWINMSEANARSVSCGFFDMGNNTFWMNQDFVVSR